MNFFNLTLHSFYSILLNLIHMNCNPSVICYMLKQPLGQFVSSSSSLKTTDSGGTKLSD